METAKQIRSDLRYLCSDLCDIVISDLVECKWNAKKKIFSSLLQNSKALSPYHDKLVLLNEEHSKVIVSLKKQIGSDSTKLDVEKNYRSTFLQIVAEACTHLRWPPALEPFSDIVSQLFDDKAAVLDAMSHMAKYGFPDSYLESRHVNTQSLNRSKESTPEKSLQAHFEENISQSTLNSPRGKFDEGKYQRQIRRDQRPRETIVVEKKESLVEWNDYSALKESFEVISVN